MEPEGLLVQCSQELSVEPYPESDESSPHPSENYDTTKNIPKRNQFKFSLPNL
jgi:hypothetical protein